MSVASSSDAGIALVLAGGIALGAFEAGAFEALDEAGLAASVRWISASSIGAVNAVIIAGNEPGQRARQLRTFWQGVASDPAPALSFWFGPPGSGSMRQFYNQAGVLETLLLGRAGLFRPRLEPGRREGVADVPALYDLAPLASRLTELVEFDRIGHGEIRVSLSATDVVSGERIVFDTGRRCVLTPRHVLASSAFLPLFAPVEFDGRLFGDGGLASNAPLDVIMAEAEGRAMRCLVVDLFAPEGSRPRTLAASASRAADLSMGNQSRRILEGHDQADRLRRMISELGAMLPAEALARPEVQAILAEGRSEPTEIDYISYRAGLDEAGLGKVFDFSTATIRDRWAAGRAQVERMLETQAGHAAEEPHA